MAESTHSQVARGHITVVQEQRFRMVTDAGQGMLFTLSRGAQAHQADLHRFHEAYAHVAVEYMGEPNLASGVAQAVYPIE